MPLDIFGNEVHIGDSIVYIQKAGSGVNELRRGIVTSFSKGGNPSITPEEYFKKHGYRDYIRTKRWARYV